MALQPQDEKALNELLEDQLPPTVEQALTKVTSLIGDRMAALAKVVPQIDPTLEGTVRTTLGKMQHEMQTLHNKVIQAAKRKDETLRRQFQRAQALTFPQGHPQEREIGFVWFLNRYGPALVDPPARGDPARDGPAPRAEHLRTERRARGRSTPGLQEHPPARPRGREVAPLIAY
jgi:uncharacterized protein YllA (UPF0747 family)